MINIPVPEHDDALKLHDFSRMSEQEFHRSIAMGYRYVIYQYTVSVFIYTATRPTKVFRTQSRKAAWVKGLPYSVVCLLFGWWHVPGILSNVGSLYHNFKGGVDVSAEVLEYIRQQDPMYTYGMR